MKDQRWVKVTRKDLEEADKSVIRGFPFIVFAVMFVGWCIDQDGELCSVDGWVEGGRQFRYRWSVDPEDRRV